MVELRFTKAVQNYFKKMKQQGLKDAYRSALNKIANGPDSGELKAGDLAGIYGYDIYYNKTNYEIAYRIYEENGRIVVIILAGTRENFYKELKRYMR